MIINIRVVNPVDIFEQYERNCKEVPQVGNFIELIERGTGSSRMFEVIKVLWQEEAYSDKLFPFVYVQEVNK